MRNLRRKWRYSIFVFFLYFTWDSEREGLQIVHVLIELNVLEKQLKYNFLFHCFKNLNFLETKKIFEIMRLMEMKKLKS